MKISGLLSLVGFAVALCASIASCGGGTTNVTPYPAHVSAEGDSCANTIECAVGLICRRNTCTNPANVTVADSGMGGSDTGTTAAGNLGQQCTVGTNECGTGLTCVPSSALGGLLGGVCDKSSFGVTPTGMSCSGECKTAADCCELPYDFTSYYGSIYGISDAGTAVYVRTCDDLLHVAIGGDATVCATAVVGTILSEACNLFQNFCNGCTTNTWQCTSSSQCVYTGPCTVGRSSYYAGGCPYLTRSGRTTGYTCTGGDAGTTGTCGGTSSGCTAAADCVGKTTVDVSTSYPCTGASDCTCYQGGCYFKCSSNLDCSAGYACDTTSGVCKVTGCTPGTSGDTLCRAAYGKETYKCSANEAGVGSCVLGCTSDHDCSPYSGAIPGTGTFTSVCYQGLCTSASGSCSTDADCLASASGGVNMFCVTPTTSAAVRSAVANH